MKYLLLTLCLLALGHFMPAYAADNATPTVLVSISPYKFFVERIAGGTLHVEVMVPPGASSHTFEPTPRQMLSASKAGLWFQIGEGFEPRASQALQSHNPDLKLANLRKGLDLISHADGHAHCCHTHDSCTDPHFWLSPKECKIQAATIAKALMERYPQNKILYEENLHKLLEELDQVNRKISEILKPSQNRVILVGHPAYAYFCRDYGLTQMSIEFEGKDPTPQQLTKILAAARKNSIKAIFVQPQYSSKGARLIADQIGAKVVVLDPYAEDILNSMLDIAHAFASQGG